MTASVFGPEHIALEGPVLSGVAVDVGPADALIVAFVVEFPELPHQIDDALVGPAFGQIGKFLLLVGDDQHVAGRAHGVQIVGDDLVQVGKLCLDEVGIGAGELGKAHILVVDAHVWISLERSMLLMTGTSTYRSWARVRRALESFGRQEPP